jgi:hypothetical protein
VCDKPLQAFGDVSIFQVESQSREGVQGGQQIGPPEGELKLEPVGFGLAIVVFIGLEETVF